MSTKSSNIKAYHTDGIAFLRQMNEHSVKQIKNARDIRMDVPGLHERARRVVHYNDVNVVFDIETTDG